MEWLEEASPPGGTATAGWVQQLQWTVPQHKNLFQFATGGPPVESVRGMLLLTNAALPVRIENKGEGAP